MISSTSSTVLPNIWTPINIATKAIGKTIYTGIPSPAGIYPNSIVIEATNNEYQICVLTWSMWLHPAPIDDIIVVSDIGEQWSPNIAPVKVSIVPIRETDEVVEAVKYIEDGLKLNDITFVTDKTDKSPGFKFAESEVKGYPVRVEIGPRDLENNQVTLVRRDTREKITLDINEKLPEVIASLLDEIHNDMYEKALAFRNEHITTVETFDHFKEVLNAKGGYVKMPWCGDEECEVKIKEETAATSRCIDTTIEATGVCPICGKEAKHIVYFAKAY